MGRPGITKEEVAAAVSALRAQGRPTTTRVVRLEVGKGSYATISRFLDALGAKSAGKPEKLDEMPEDIQARLADCALSMWQTVCQATSRTRTALTTQCEQRIQVLSRELAREREMRKTADRELGANQQRLSACRLEGQHLRERVAMLREELAGEQAVLKRLERDRGELLERFGRAAQLSFPREPGRPRTSNPNGVRRQSAQHRKPS